jgi:hypothetical protein
MTVKSCLAGPPTSPARTRPVLMPNVDLEGHLQPRVLVDAGGAVADLDRRVHRLPGRVLQAGRDPEERHDAVAEVLVDVASVAGDDLLEKVEAPVHELRHVLGVRRPGHRGEARDVGKHHRRVGSFRGLGRYVVTANVTPPM